MSFTDDGGLVDGAVADGVRAQMRGRAVGTVMALVMLMALVSGAEAATTYVFIGAPYSAGPIVNLTPPCATGPCANYAPTMRISGWFTTDSPLPPNLPGVTEISPLVTSFRFTDGINSFSSSDPNVRRIQFAVGTDSTGNILRGGDTSIVLQLWQTGSAPHSTTDRLAFLIIDVMQDTAGNNGPCPNVVPGPSLSGDTDVCSVTGNSDASTSRALPEVFGAWLISRSADAPAHSQKSLALLIAALGSLGGWMLHRDRSSRGEGRGH